MDKLKEGWYKIQYPDLPEEEFQVSWISDNFVTQFVGDDRGPLLEDLLEHGTILTPVVVVTQAQLDALLSDAYTDGWNERGEVEGL